MKVRKSYLVIHTISLEKKGRRWPHKHKQIPLRDHPRGGDVRFTFMLEDDEPDKIEMCSTCSARRMKPKDSSPLSFILNENEQVQKVSS